MPGFETIRPAEGTINPMDALDGFDHPILEIVKDENGLPSTYHLGKLVDAYRSGTKEIDFETGIILGVTEVLAHAKASAEGTKMPTWGHFSDAFAEVMYFESSRSKH